MADGVVIQQSDVSVNDAFGLLGKSADDNRAKLDVLDASIMKIIEHQKLLLSNNDTTTQKGIQQLFDINEELNTQTQKTIKLEQDRLRLEKISEQAKQAAIRTRQLEQKEVDNSTKKAEREAAAQEKLNSVYNKVQIKLNGLRKEYQDLAVKKELGIKLTDKEAKRYEFLGGKITRYDGVLKSVDASQGKYQRNVGNYASAFNGLGNSVQQLTREFPAFAVNAQTGILAISNNLPILFDEISKIREANKGLAAEGKPTVSAFKQIGQSIFSVAGILSLAVTAFTILGPKLVEWFESMSGGNKALDERRAKQKAANEETKKATEFVGRESAEYVGYILELKKTNEGSKKRSDLISEINDKYGVTLKNLKDERLFQAQLNNEVLNYIKYQRARYEVDKNQDLIARNLENQDKARIETARSLGISVKQLDLFAESVRKAMQKEQEAIDNGTLSVARFVEKNEELAKKDFTTSRQETLEDYVNTIDAANKRLESYGFNILTADTEMDELGYDTEKTTKETQKLNTALKEFDDALERRLDLGEQERRLRQDMLQINNEIRASVLSDVIQGELDGQREYAETTGQIYVDTLEKLIAEEFDMRREAIIQQSQFERDELLKRIDGERVLEFERLKKERDELLLQEGLTNEQRAQIRASYEVRLQELNSRMLDAERIVALEREKIELELQQNLGNLDQERVDRLNEVNNELIKAQEEYAKDSNKANEDRLKKQADDEKKAADEEKKRLKEQQKFREKAIDEGLKYAIEASKEREKLIDKEISDSQKAADALRQQAAQGNADAKESLAALDDTIEEKQKLKQKEQQQQQLIEELQLLYDATQNYVEKGDSLPVAGSKALFQVTGLRALFKTALSGVKGFFGGTKRTVGEELGAPLFPGKDGHLIRVDGSEKILNPELSAKTGNATTDDIVAGYTLARAMSLGQIAPSVNYRQSTQIESEVASGIKELTKVIKSKPDRVISAEVENGIAKAILITERSTTRTTRTRHKSSR